MRGNTQTDSKSAPFPSRIGPRADVGDGDPMCATREPVVRAASLRAAIAQLRDLTMVNANRSSQEALAANLVLLRAHGVDDEVLDLVVEMVLAQNVDEEMTAAVNYLASGFLLALLTLEEEVSNTANAGSSSALTEGSAGARAVQPRAGSACGARGAERKPLASDHGPERAPSASLRNLGPCSSHRLSGRSGIPTTRSSDLRGSCGPRASRSW